MEGTGWTTLHIHECFLGRPCGFFPVSDLGPLPDLAKEAVGDGSSHHRPGPIQMPQTTARPPDNLAD
jgi:hypothetical protein